MSIGYLECFSGISGDMLLGALVDAGVSFQHLEETAAALGVGARLQMRKVSRGGLAATKVDVLTPDTPAAEPEDSHHDHPGDTHAGHQHQAHSHPAHSHAPHRALASILESIRSAPLSDAVKARASRAFQLLGEAEAAIHSVPVEEVHFHEVGAVDTIVDVVCAAAGAEALDRELGVVRWLASPLNVGSGTVVCQHGTLPVPAPATLALLGRAPVYAAGTPMERVTPTGAVLLRMLDVRYEPLPPMRIVKTGYGAGGRETPGEPNLLRLLVGEEESTGSAASGSEAIAVMETVIDDCNPQLLAYVSERLLEAGAWDVYRAAVQMKKGRAGVQMTILCRPDLVSALRDLLFRETTTIGLRWRLENKISLAREFVDVETRWGKVRIKVARLPNGEQANAAPEYEDCRRLAIEHAVPLKLVTEEAMRAYAASGKEKS
jgi:hypothetical protein